MDKTSIWNQTSYFLLAIGPSTPILFKNGSFSGRAMIPQTISLPRAMYDT